MKTIILILFVGFISFVKDFIKLMEENYLFVRFFKLYYWCQIRYFIINIDYQFYLFFNMDIDFKCDKKNYYNTLPEELKMNLKVNSENGYISIENNIVNDQEISKKQDVDKDNYVSNNINNHIIMNQNQNKSNNKSNINNQEVRGRRRRKINNKNNNNNKFFDVKAIQNIISGHKLNKAVNKKINDIKLSNKQQLDGVEGGYLSYTKNKTYLGYLIELTNINLLHARISERLLVKLDPNKIYAIIMNVSYVNNGVLSGLSPIKSLIVSGNSNVKLIGQNILNGVNKVLNEYNIDDDKCVVTLYWRPWISDSEYHKLVTPVQRKEIIDEVLHDQAQLNLDRKAKLDKINKILNIKNNVHFITEFPNYDSVIKLQKYYNSELYAYLDELVNNHTEDKFKYYVFIEPKMNECSEDQGSDNFIIYIVFESDAGNKRFVCMCDVDSWKSFIKYWNKPKYPYPRWTDYKTSETEFVRQTGEYKYYIHNGQIKYWERIYDFQDMLFTSIDQVVDTRIGTLDLETYGDNLMGSGLGRLSVYAGGIALNTGYKDIKYIDTKNGITNGDELIIKLFDNLFNHIAEDKKIRNQYTLYAHNLGRFDSVFLLKTLSNAGYDLKGHWKDNDILVLKITDKQRKLTVKLKDSMKLLPSSLEKLLISYGCDINKGMFPHKFVSANNLNYIGYKPDIKYYIDNKLTSGDKGKIKEYNNLPEIFNLKEECLNYLEKDILGLLEIMNKVSNHYFNEYKLNITKFSTLPSISLAIYGFWFKDNKHKIKMIKGPLEGFIRQAYFGGNSQIFVKGKDRLVKEGYHYDMNSQYPYAMKNMMPTGNPIFTNNKDINYYKLGFVLAKITPPTKEVLTNLFIQTRNEDGSISCPRDTFYEYISTVDLKQGLQYGYKAEIFCGVNFPDACEEGEIFGQFVDTLYKIKSTSTDPVEKQIAKLSLNSTYGKFAQKEQEYTIKLASKDAVKEILSKYHYTYLSEISDELTLIKSGPRINSKLKRLYKTYSEFNNNNEDLNNLDTFVKQRGIPTAVQISAIIAAYARTSINIYKNIPDNIAIASNTDSLILSKPLPNELIGTELGQWKLEHHFKEGVFVRPKLYCYVDVNNNELIRKASGVVAGYLKYQDYLNLAKGKNVSTNKEIFKVNWKELKIDIVNVETKLKGIKNDT